MLPSPFPGAQIVPTPGSPGLMVEARCLHADSRRQAIIDDPPRQYTGRSRWARRRTLAGTNTGASRTLSIRSAGMRRAGYPSRDWNTAGRTTGPKKTPLVRIEKERLGEGSAVRPGAPSPGRTHRSVALLGPAADSGVMASWRCRESPPRPLGRCPTRWRSTASACRCRRAESSRTLNRSEQRVSPWVACSGPWQGCSSL